MDFIRSNKSLIIGLTIGVLVIVIIVSVVLNTNLFNEDAQLAEEIEESIDEETGEAIVESNVQETTEVPEEIEGIIEEDITEDNLNGEHSETFTVWEDHGLDYEEGDNQLIRDMKSEARVNTYNDYQTIKENGGEYNGVDYEDSYLGELLPDEYYTNSEYLYNTNNIVKIGDIEVIDAAITSEGINMIVRNNGELTTKTDFVEKLNVEFGDAEYMDEDLYYTEYSGEEVDDYLVGKGMVVSVKLEYISGEMESMKDTREVLTEFGIEEDVDAELEGALVFDYMYEEDNYGNTNFFSDNEGEITYEEFVDSLPNSYTLSVGFDGETGDIQLDKGNDYDGYDFGYEEDKRS